MSRKMILVTALLLSLNVTASADVEYQSLDEAIESELEGIDFTIIEDVDEMTIFGEDVVPPGLMTDFVRQHNPGFDSAIAEAYIAVGRRYGIRGDIAFCQAILETGWFKFDKGTAVSAENHNYCGLGVIKKGMTGVCFDDITTGVTAHIQHLYAYACKHQLPEDEIMADPRFGAVRRGVARVWSDLNNRWAMNNDYGQKILKIYGKMLVLADTAKQP